MGAWRRLFDGQVIHDCAGEMRFGDTWAVCSGCGAEWRAVFKTNARGDEEPVRWDRIGPLSWPESRFYPPDEPF